jgi:uncharacterized protein
MKLQLHLLLLLLLPFIVCSQDFPASPNPPRLVNDFTSTLSQNEKEALEQKLVAFNDSTSTQISIVIISSVGEYEIADYTFQLGEKWGIGRKEKNNGALILVAKDDRKVYIATGYGLEGAIPDALAKRIVEQQIVPEFKQGNYYAGLDAATDVMIKLASGEYTADDVKRRLPARFLPVIFILLIIFIIFISKFRSAKRYSAVNGIDFLTAWTLLNATRSASRGRWGNFSGGSSWGGGSSGGGGFGGFGGGSFGGGGAGGSW